jgi:pimeloyl-ACP methyl ester carboxylesterase
MPGEHFRQDFLQAPDGTSLYFQLWGEGEPAIVLCDGLGCDGFAWKYLLPDLRSSHRVLRWHYRGHGRSSAPDDPSRIGMLYNCEDLAQLMNAAGLKQAVIFGHSMGVQVALEFHRRHRDRVLALVLICGSYGNPLDTVHDAPMLKNTFPLLRGLVERFPKLASRLIALVLRTEVAMQLVISMELNREMLDRTDIVPYFDHLARMDPRVFVRTLDSLAEHSAWDHLSRVDVPTLIISGENDRFTPSWLSHRMAESVPGAQFMIVPQGSHTAPLEEPELIWRKVERFLRERSTPTLK